MKKIIKKQNIRLLYTKPKNPKFPFWIEYRLVAGKKRLFLVLQNRKKQRTFYHYLNKPLLMKIMEFVGLTGRIYHMDKANEEIRFENLNTWEKLIGKEMFTLISKDRQSPTCFKNIKLHDFNNEEFIKGSCGNCNLTKGCKMKEFLYKRFKNGNPI